jgi:membrane associated rhomboid family serine protease
MMRITETVKQLIIINVIFFVGSWLIGQPAVDFLALHFPSSTAFKPWQFITYMFMHGGIMHILFNMLGIAMFGSALEHFWGVKKFIFFYISCGIGAAALHLGIQYYFYYDVIGTLTQSGYNKTDILALLNQGKYNQEWLQYITERQFNNFMQGYFSPMLGASGALYGIIVAFAFMFPNAELMLIFFPIPIKAKYFVPGLLCYDLFFGLKGQSIFGFGDDGIAHFAHLGGALIGFIMMWYWRKNSFNQNRWN